MDKRPAPPIALLAELTHRCPLSCPYCSNPLELLGREAELDTATWLRVFHEAAALGVLQLHLSGGEPAARRDLEALVAGARQAGLYVNLITSGIGLTAQRVDQMIAGGLDHIQLSLQGVRAEVADAIGGYAGGFARKLALAEVIAERDVPLTLNAVMHRHNLDDLADTIAFAARLGARRVEVACVQFYGWGLKNQAALQPSRAQVDEAKRVVAAARLEWQGRLAIDFVPPDYHADFPKACMGGWGSTGLNVTPDGTVLPCHAAATIPTLQFQKVTEATLSDIWYQGPAFRAYRGTDWMPDTCQSCVRRDIDHGGCRCQAMALAGDPNAIDPVCRHSPARATVDRLLAEASTASLAETTFTYRR